ncbi:PIR protein [Plasmodium vivax]|uniref:VIR protein n=1 Tax=Plasmodium vivax TaxID=5855 RepID=A0A564ZU43_PLAVI|nr:PIR protein [Plasmodium vivax]
MTDNIIGSSPKSDLLKFYKHLDDFIISDSSPVECSEQSNQIILKICPDLRKILQKWTNVWAGYEKSTSDICQHLTYWLYGKAMKCESDYYCFNWIYSMFYEFFVKASCYKYEMFDSQEIFSRVFNADTIKNKKDLYDFLNHYSDIKELLKKPTQNKTQYCKYIKYMFDIYQNMKEERRSKLTKVYNNEIAHFEKIIKDEVNYLNDMCKNTQESKHPLKSMNSFELVKEESKEDVDFTNGSLNRRRMNNYDIFKDLDVYQNAENYIKTQSNDAYRSIECNNFKKTDDKVEPSIEHICINFRKLLIHLASNVTNEVKANIKYHEYLNYWLNRELRNLDKDSTFRKEYCKHMEETNSKIDAEGALKNKIYDLNDDEYENMNILHKLYDYYYKILSKKDEKNNCSEYAKECINQYELGMKKSFETKNFEFYNALKKFRPLYKNYIYYSNLCKKEILLTLPILKTFKEKSKEEFLQKTANSCAMLNNHNENEPPQRNQIYDSILTGLTAQEQYKILNNCNAEIPLCSKYCGSIIPFSDKENGLNGLKKFCAKFANNLINLSDKLKNVNSAEDRCSYFTYWTYDKILDMFDNKTNSAHFHSILNGLNEVLYQVNNSLPEGAKSCLFYLDGNFEKWEEEKYLHDYFKNYDKISKCVDNCDTYCEYLNYIADLYSKNINKCCTCFIRPTYNCINKCPTYFKCEQTYFPNYLMSKLKCENIKANETSDEVFTNRIIDLDVTRRSPLESENSCKHLLCDPFNAFASISFAFLGIFSTLFVFYKFTPFGSWINKKSHKKKIAVEMFREDAQIPIQYSSRSRNSYPPNRIIRLAYSSD